MTSAKSIASVAVIIATYNNPRWLQKVLWSYEAQSRPADEIIIADDGSTKETADLLATFKALPLKHVWHEDQGFRKTLILNKAIMASSADYLIFTDGDCVARADMVETHLNAAENGYFISSGYQRLPMPVSEALTQDDIKSGRAFDYKWLRKNGLPAGKSFLKLQKSPFWAQVLNHLTPTKASWNGCNSSCFRANALAVNGFNEKMAYGGEDREFGERLSNMGLKSKQLRYAAICLHLDHKRPYKNAEVIMKNRAFRAIVKKHHLIKTPFGLEKLQEGAEYYEQKNQ